MLTKTTGNEGSTGRQRVIFPSPHRTLVHSEETSLSVDVYNRGGQFSQKRNRKTGMDLGNEQLF